MHVLLDSPALNSGATKKPANRSNASLRCAGFTSKWKVVNSESVEALEKPPGEESAGEQASKARDTTT